MAGIGRDCPGTRSITCVIIEAVVGVVEPMGVAASLGMDLAESDSPAHGAVSHGVGLLRPTLLAPLQQPSHAS